MNKDTQFHKSVQTDVISAEKPTLDVSHKALIKGPVSSDVQFAPSKQTASFKSEKLSEKPLKSVNKKKQEEDAEILEQTLVSLGDLPTPSEAPLLLAQATTPNVVVSDAGGGASTAAPAAQATAVAGAAGAGSGFSALGLLGGIAAIGALAGGGGGGGQQIAVDKVAPTITSLVADSATGKITLTYSEALNAVKKPNPSAFTVSIGGTPNTVAGVEVSGNTVVLTMTNPIPASGPVSVAYQDPTNADDPAAIQDAAGNDAASFANIVVADGYIRGAKVYIDTNKNGRIDVDADTYVGETDRNGNILIPGNLPSGTMLVQGGVNIDTGVPNTMVLKAPVGSTAITPLTTLVQTVVEQKVAANPTAVVNAALIQTAMTTVATALGLTDSLGGKSLTSFDPIAENNTVVQKAAAQVATIVTLAAGNDAAKSAEVIENLTTKIANNGTAPAIALESAAVLTQILPSSVSQAVKDEITDAAESIRDAVSISAISTAQSQSLDKTAAAKPTLDAPVLTNKPAAVSVKVLFENKATDGTSVITGDIIQLKNGSVAVGTAATVTDIDLAAGFKVITVSLEGADRAHTLTASITDKAGNVSLASAGAVVTVDTVAAAPVVAAVATDNIVNAAEKTASGGVAVSGTAEAGASVAVTWGTTTKTVTAATGGNWTANFTAAEVPEDGNTSVSAVATDLAGNKSDAGTRAVTLDTAVAAPVMAAVSTDNIVNAAEKTAGVAVSGTAEAGASVAVTWGATTKTVTATDGNWTANFTSAEVPADGNTTVSAVATDVVGNVSVAGIQTVAVDTAVAAPAVAAVSTNDIVNAAEKTAGVAVSGTAEAGANVAVTWGTTTETVKAENGNWTAIFASTKVPGDGNTSVSAVATDVAGNVSVAGTRVVAVDTAAPTATASIEKVEDNVPSTAITEVAKGATTNDNTPTLVGVLTAALGAGEVLAVFDGATRLGNAEVNGTAWRFVSTSLTNGAHSLTVRVEDQAGNQGVASEAHAFTVDATVPAATAAVTALAPAVNQVMPAITGTITGTMASGDVVKVFDGSTLLGTATVSGSAWTFTPSVALTQGQHKITAVVENAGGTQSALSSEMTFTVDSVAPAVPVLTSFSDNSGLATDNITNDKTVTFNMTAEAGSKLEIFSGNTSLGLATESATAGTFSFTTASLADGSYTFRAVSKDAAGNAATLSSIPVVIDTVAPAKPVIRNWSDTDDTKVTLVIESEPGSSVSVSNGTTVLGLAIETATRGVFEFTTNVGSADRFSFTTSAKDVAGNTSVSNTQTAIYVSGESLETKTSGSVDLRVVSSDSSKVSFSVTPKGTFAPFSDAGFELTIPTSKVSYTDGSATLWGGLSDANLVGQNLIVQVSDLNLSVSSPTTSLINFSLNWLSAPTPIDLSFKDLSLGSNTSINPSFSFTPGNGVANGTAGDDLIITGSGDVSVTSGTGKDTVMLESVDVNLTLTDFLFGTDQIDVSGLLFELGYTSTGTTAAPNVAAMLATAPAGIASLISSKDSSLDNKFGAWFEPATVAGGNKGVLYLFGDTNPAVGATNIAPALVDIVIGPNSSGTFSTADLMYQLPTPVVL